MAMTHIFEAETELGRCDPDRIGSPVAEDDGQWLVIASTSANSTGARGLLRIEQRCFLRCVERPNEVRPQNCVSPQMSFEPVSASREETIQAVQQLHACFVLKSKDALSEESLLSASTGIPELSS